MGKVSYATSRNPDSPTTPTSYGIDFNGPAPCNLIFGQADVTAAPGHDPKGLPFEAQGPLAIQLSDASPGDFSPAAKLQILNGPAHLIVSVHGFQYLFWESVARADHVSRWFAEGQFANANTMVMFGWPSAGKLGAYERDWKYATGSGPALSQMLATLWAADRRLPRPSWRGCARHPPRPQHGQPRPRRRARRRRPRRAADL
jgi:hypothetical protein